MGRNAGRVVVTDTRSATQNRTLLEISSGAYHEDPDGNGGPTANGTQRHQLLAKLMNNTTTVSNCFIVFATAGYFEAYEDTISVPGESFWRIGGRIGLDLDEDGDPTNDAGWEQRAVFVIDRTELLDAYNAETGELDWERLVRYQATLK